MPAKSIREIARALGLSHTTVSEALRESPRVKMETRKLVQDAAREAGYRPNPLAGALMSEMRRSHSGLFRGVLAVVDLESPEVRTPVGVRYHREVMRGVEAAAQPLGFKIEPFVLGRENLSLSRLDSILKSRGIRGVLLLPAGVAPDISGLDWNHYAGIYTDYIIEKPPLDSVCADHFRSMMVAMQKLAELGYRRPGLVLQEAHDRRLLYRWEAAFRAFNEHYDHFENRQPLVREELDRETFLMWFKCEQPDVVCSHRPEVFQWMKDAGAEVPRTHGYCWLNVMSATGPGAGLDLQPRAIGMRAAKLLIAQLHRNEYGIPEIASTTTIPAAWVDGPTVRAQKREKVKVIRKRSKQAAR